MTSKNGGHWVVSQFINVHGLERLYWWLIKSRWFHLRFFQFFCKMYNYKLHEMNLAVFIFLHQKCCLKCFLQWAMTRSDMHLKIDTWYSDVNVLGFSGKNVLSAF